MGEIDYIAAIDRSRDEQREDLASLREEVEGLRRAEQMAHEGHQAALLRAEAAEEGQKRLEYVRDYAQENKGTLRLIFENLELRQERDEAREDLKRFMVEVVKFSWLGKAREAAGEMRLHADSCHACKAFLSAHPELL